MQPVGGISIVIVEDPLRQGFFRWEHKRGTAVAKRSLGAFGTRREAIANAEDARRRFDDRSAFSGPRYSA